MMINIDVDHGTQAGVGKAYQQAPGHPPWLMYTKTNSRLQMQSRHTMNDRLQCES